MTGRAERPVRRIRVRFEILAAQEPVVVGGEPELTERFAAGRRSAVGELERDPAR